MEKAKNMEKSEFWYGSGRSFGI